MLDFIKTKLRKAGNNSGFTLIELIVILMILAILAAVLVPKLTGWIDESMRREALSEAHLVLTATQTSFNEGYVKMSDAEYFKISIGETAKDSLSAVTDRGNIAATTMFWRLMVKDFPNIGNMDFETISAKSETTVISSEIHCKNTDTGMVIMPFRFTSKNGYTVRYMNGEFDSNKNSKELPLLKD